MDIDANVIVGQIVRLARIGALETGDAVALVDGELAAGDGAGAAAVGDFRTQFDGSALIQLLVIAADQQYADAMVIAVGGIA